MNVVLLVGNLTSQPETQTCNGRDYCRCYIETKEYYTKKDGTPAAFSSRHKLLADYGNPLKALAACNQGDLVDIQGKLKYSGGKDKPVICEVQVISCAVILRSEVAPECLPERPEPKPKLEQQVLKNFQDDDGDLPPF